MVQVRLAVCGEGVQLRPSNVDAWYMVQVGLAVCGGSIQLRPGNVATLPGSNLTHLLCMTVHTGSLLGGTWWGRSAGLLFETEVLLTTQVYLWPVGLWLCGL